jgi:hypothetical protein
MPPGRVVGLVDVAGRTVGPLGGRARKELRDPSALFAAGDTLYVADWGLRRTTLWTREGRFARAVPTTAAVRGALPRDRDAAGRFYLELAPPARPDGSHARDSAAVVRAGAALERADTIARLAPLDLAEVRDEGGRRFERRVLSGEDHWGVLPDGSLWVARVYQNRVDWRAPGGEWLRGALLPDRVLEVTRYDRELFVRRFPPELRASAHQLPFAAIKPPFEGGLASASGEVWLRKSRAPADSAGRYHVIDRRGRLVREVRVPGPGQVVAVSRDAALVAEPFAEGTRLLRFALAGSAPVARALVSARDGGSFE